MRTTDHSLGEGVHFKAHSKGSHLSGGKASLEELVTPGVHLGFPVGKAVWKDLGEVVSGSKRTLANIPHVTPLHVVLRRKC